MSQFEMRQMDAERGGGLQQREAVPLYPPLNRLNSTDRNEQREHIRYIFNKYDTNHDGLIGVPEIKRLIREHQCPDMPTNLARHILEVSDHDGDNHLNFEEFYRLSIVNQWFFKSYVTKYCKLIVPPRQPRPVQQPMGMHSRTAVPAYDETDGAYENSMSCCPPPITMVVFSIIEILIFLYDIFYLKADVSDLDRLGKSTKGPAATLFIYNPFRREEAWRFVSYMFVHVGVMHLLMNLIVQIFLGVALELVHSWWRVSLVYLAGVVAGSMGTSLASPHIFLAGASGGVYALITAHIATIIMNWSEMEYAIVQLFVFLVFCLTDLGMSIYRHISDANDQIGYMAHLSGAIAGLLVGIGVLRNLKVRPWEKKLWWFAITVYTALMLGGVAVHIFIPEHFPMFKNKYI